MESVYHKEERQIIAEKALESIKNENSGTLAISMGVGKTLIALKDADFHYKNKTFLVVGPKLEVHNTWINQAKQWGYTHLNFEFCTYYSLSKRDPKKYVGVYFDECHNILPTHEGFLRAFTGRMIGLTGTPPTYTKGSKYLLIDRYFPIRFTYKIQDAIDSKIVNSCKIIVHMLPLSDKKFLQKTKKRSFFTTENKSYSFWTSKILNATPGDGIAYNIMRMKAMQGFPSKEEYTIELLKKIKGKCLIFANTKEQADRICSYSHHSSNKYSSQNLEMFKSGDILRLSAVEQLSEGINIPHLRSAIIMHSYSNSRRTLQKIGRLLRLSVDQLSYVHILCYQDTVDETWVGEALKHFDSQNIKFYYKNV